MSRELFSLEAEQGVLGAILLEAARKNDALVEEILAAVQPSHFYFDHNAALLEVIQECHAEGMPVDAYTLSITRTYLVEDLRTLDYAAELSRNVPSSANWKAYAKVLAERAVLRSVVAAADAIKQSTTEDKDIPEIIAGAQMALADLRDLGDTDGPDYKPISDVITKNVELIDERFNGRAPRGLSTGLADLDDLLRGLRPRTMTVIAGLPGSGKTLLALQICQHVAVKAGGSALVFSLEMPEEELGQRALASLGAVDVGRLDSGKLHDDDWPRLTSAVNQAVGKNLFISDVAGLTPARIRAIARTVQRKHGLDIMAIDYLGLIPGDRQGRSRSEEIGKITKAIVRLSKELGIPILLLAQLNRESTKRAGSKRPQSSDLRDSGEIEADAHAILMVHRDMESDRGKAGITELLLTKCRHAPPGECVVQAQGNFARFVNVLPQHHGQDEIEAGRPYQARYQRGAA